MRSERSGEWAPQPGGRASLSALALLIAPLYQVRAETPRPTPPAAADGYVCPPVPEALVKRRAATGDVPAPSPEDLTAYRRYVQQIEVNDWGFLCRYAQENRDLAAGQRPRVVLFGDSITENWKARDPALFSDGIVDRGISGQTTPQMLLRFYQDVIALRPRVVHIMAGTNDIAGNTGPTSDAQFRDNIRAMVDLAHVHGITVMLASIPPAAVFSWRPELRPAARIRAWNDWLRSYAKSEQLIFVDYYPALADAAGAMRPAFTTDGAHPTRAGYQPMDVLFRRGLAEAERK